MKVLELFSGTRSIGKVCDQLGWESVSVDLILPADHEVDIMDFDYKQYDKDEFDIVWGSPPCTNYSALKKCWYGRKLKDGTIYNKELNKKDQDDADKLVLKTLEIINYFNPYYWFIENPQTGNLKNREIMKDIPFYDVDYCMYSDWGYKKRTRIWTNKKDWSNLLCNGKCGNMLDNRKHKVDLSVSIGCGSQLNQPKDLKYLGKGTNRIDRYRIPEDLIFSLFLEFLSLNKNE
jgi:site-specific DNA-cytosine methylase